MIYIPKNKKELDLFVEKQISAVCSIGFKYKEEDRDKYVDSACQFLGFQKGLKSLEEYWFRNPSSSLGEEAHVLFDKDGKVHFINADISYAGYSKFIKHELSVSEKEVIPFTEEQLKKISEEYVFSNVYHKQKENNKNNEVFILDTKPNRIIQDIYIFDRLGKMAKHKEGTGSYSNEYTSETTFKPTDKIPEIRNYYEGKLDNKEMIVQLLRKGSYQLVVLKDDDTFHYEIYLNSRSELYSHLDNMYIGKSKFLIFKII